MSKGKKSYIVIFGKNEFEHFQIILWAWIRNFEIEAINHGFVPRVLGILKHIPFVKEYVGRSIKQCNVYVGHYKGLWHEICKETIDLTVDFYIKEFERNPFIIDFYNRILSTNKFESYIKKEISLHLFSLLAGLHIMRLSPHLKEKNILIIKTPVNIFIVKYMEEKYNINYKISWIPSLFSPLCLCAYYLYLIKELLKKEIVLNKDRKKYKLSLEAAWDFHRKALTGDIMLGHSRFKKKDILMLQFYLRADPEQARAFKEAKERGFNFTSSEELKVNINKNIFNILSFYLLLPVKFFLELLLVRKLYLFYYVFLFHKRCFPVELLMNLYDIKCNISFIAYDDIVSTIILNKYGTKNFVCQWSDISSSNEYINAFIAHNIYFTWGNAHYNHHVATRCVDKYVNIGCIFKEGYNKVARKKKDIILQIPNSENRKTVVFFDNSFNNDFLFTERFFLDFMKMIKEFCERYSDVNVLLKPKNEKECVSSSLRDHLHQYEKICFELSGFSNFKYLDPLKSNVEEAIAISDVSITMGMATPSTIALICGKNALYFDDTGNQYHPFATKYKNILVFEDKNLLLEQIKNILDGKFNCSDIISEREIREFDAFPDDKALERLRENIYQLTL